jgi:hypothetical protein
MLDSGLTPAALAFDARQQRFIARLANECEGSQSKECFYYPTPGALVARVAAIEHAHGRRADARYCPDLGENPVVKTTILEYNIAATRALELWENETESKLRSGTWTW